MGGLVLVILGLIITVTLGLWMMYLDRFFEKEHTPNDWYEI